MSVLQLSAIAAFVLHNENKVIDLISYSSAAQSQRSTQRK